MSSNSSEASSLDTRSLAASLAPLLQSSCGDRLGEITWFKADWQRGGAATGTSSFLVDDGRAVPVVVKLPVGPREQRWTHRLQAEGDEEPVVPKLFAFGEYLGGYDLAWLVLERLEFGPLGLHWHEQHVVRIADAIARFHQRARAYEIDQPPRTEPWDELVKEAQQNVRTSEIPELGRWSATLKTFRQRLDRFVELWERRPIEDWLHGDAHIANAMSRHGIDEGPVSLIDLAEVHSGHWIEDAVYLERQLWARPERLAPIKPVKAVADARRRLGLPVDPDYPTLAMVRRGLLAATAPRFCSPKVTPSTCTPAWAGWRQRSAK